MHSLLDITAEDISMLDDSSLRELIGRLCEADYRAAGLPTSGITWGGNQDAADGGFDVVVDSDCDPPSESFIQRKRCGIQVKKPDMPRASILREMRPSGNLRPGIHELIDCCGSYMIASSTGSVTHSALKSRKDAMHEAIQTEPRHSELHLDFLDRNRIATWVRLHPSLILWVRSKVGRPFVGWRPFENWSHAPGGADEEYLIDNHLRLHDGIKNNNHGLTITDGLSRLRSLLAVSGASVRLTGLSGVGKTRLVQALFDERLGLSALDRSKAFYADVADNPHPDPRTFADQLIALRARAILIVDNCPPDLHRRLARVCTARASSVSLITIEYDIREDLPDETSVFRLEAASDDVIYLLVERRFPHISEVDSRRIAEFSGGNARLAMALAATVRSGQTISGFRDEELFTRLFNQRHEHDADLLMLSETCSLVYSFNGDDTAAESELAILSKIVGRTAADAYRTVGELKERDLVQARGRWRAILPHAVANRLAARALRRVPRETIISTILGSGSDRLIGSFARRLSFLHDCDEAVQIAEQWLAPDGYIGAHINELNAFGMNMLRNVAPVAPRATLDAIERAGNGPGGDEFTSRTNQNHRDFVRLLRSLAYDELLFTRSARIIAHFVIAEESGETRDSSRDVLKSLFRLYLSGTTATSDERVTFINELLDSESDVYQSLGLDLLNESLEAWHFSSVHDFTFGSRSRTFGFHPRTRAEQQGWYRTFLPRCVRLAISNSSASEAARTILAKQFRGLWTRAGMVSELEAAAAAIRAVDPWYEGWLSVRETLRFDGANLEPTTVDALHRIERLLRPIDLIDRARTYALTEVRSFGLDEFEDDQAPEKAFVRAAEIARDIGAEVARNRLALKSLMPEIVTSNGHRLMSFGEGLWRGALDRRALWNDLYSQLRLTEASKRRTDALLGFLIAAAREDQDFCRSALDGMVTDEILGPSLPRFQAVVGLDERGARRLLQSLEINAAPIEVFRFLSFGQVPRSMDDDTLVQLLMSMASKPHGLDVAIDVLQMRLYDSVKEQEVFGDTLLGCARTLLSMYDLDSKDRGGRDVDHALAFVASRCLANEEGYAVAKCLCLSLWQLECQYRVTLLDYIELRKALAKAQPFVYLDTFIRESVEAPRLHRRQLDDDGWDWNPLAEIPDHIILLWCENSPEWRYRSALAEIPLLAKGATLDGPTWRPLVLAILDRVPQPDCSVGSLLDALVPSMWSGSRADVMQGRLPLLQTLFDHPRSEVAAWSRLQYRLQLDRISSEREREDAENRERNERFE